jgi:hypothetical protein
LLLLSELRTDRASLSHWQDAKQEAHFIIDSFRGRGLFQSISLILHHGSIIQIDSHPVTEKPNNVAESVFWENGKLGGRPKGTGKKQLKKDGK